MRYYLTKTRIVLVNSRFIRVLLLITFLHVTSTSVFSGQRNASSGRIRVIILYSRHLGAHGMGYNNRSLGELSEKLSPADIPTLITLLADRKIRVGAQFALASQCGASIVSVRDAARRHEIDFLDASDVMNLISSYERCPPEAREKARAVRDEVETLSKERQARIAREAKINAENDARIQENGLKMMDPKASKELIRQEREEVYRRSLKAMGLDENGPLTPAQKQMVETLTKR